MHSPLSATWLLPALMLPMNASGQATSTISDLGILQLMTPTMHASQFPESAVRICPFNTHVVSANPSLPQLASLSLDAMTFHTSYIEVDTFNYGAALILAVGSTAKTPGVYATLAANQAVLDPLYFQGQSSLLQNPTAYLGRLASAASPWPFSSTIMSQASGVLLGYESLVSRDLLNATASQAQVTPGMSISVSPAAATATTGSNGMMGGQATSTSKAVGVPAATGNPQLVFGAAAAVAGMLGVIML